MMRSRRRLEPLRLFARTAPPDELKVDLRRVRWETWSQEMRELLRGWAERIQALPEPALRFFGKGEYAYSLSLDLPARKETGLRHDMNRVVRAFYQMRPYPGLTLFDGLMEERISGAVLRRFFALVRSLMVHMTGDELAAIYAPLGAVGGTKRGAFPLHADLYPPALLFNVFDRVPKDGSGASLFVSANVVLRAFVTSPVV